MLDAAVLRRRLLALNAALGQLEDHPEACDPNRLASDAMLRAAVERWLQLAIEACIDMAFHVLAGRGRPAPATARAAFAALAEASVLDATLAQRLGLAAGLRNVLVHDYTDVDLSLLAAAVKNDLADLRSFGAAMGTLLP